MPTRKSDNLSKKKYARHARTASSSVIERDSLCAPSPLTHKCLCTLKGKGQQGQKEIPEETNQTKQTSHGNMSISVLMFTLFDQLVVRSKIQRKQPTVLMSR